MWHWIFVLSNKKSGQLQFSWRVCLSVALCASGFHCAAVTWADGAVIIADWADLSSPPKTFQPPTRISSLMLVHSGPTNCQKPTASEQTPIICLTCVKSQMAFGMISMTIFSVFMDLATCPWMYIHTNFHWWPKLIERAFSCASSRVRFHIWTR